MDSEGGVDGSKEANGLRCAEPEGDGLGSEVMGWLGSNALGSEEALAGKALARRPLVRKVITRERSLPEKHWPEWNWSRRSGFGGAGQKSADICPKNSRVNSAPCSPLALSRLAGSITTA